MFETAEVGNRLDKKAYAAEVPTLRTALLDIQKRLAASQLSVVIIVSGVEGAGKSETVNKLYEWLDARGIQAHAMWDTTDEERERPPMWRFWRALPPAGRIGIFFGSWYTAPIIGRVFDEIDDGRLDQALDRIVEFERMLTAERTLVLKFWFHVSKRFQKERFQALEADKKTRWRITKMDWKFFKKYDRFREVSERALRRTSTGDAPWVIVEAADPRYRYITVGRTILAALERRLDALDAAAKRPRPRVEVPAPAPVNIINRLDYRRKVGEAAYAKKIERLEGRIQRLTRRLRAARRAVTVVFEGPDAAGKGGAIRRLIACMDARIYQVCSVAAPTDEERAHPYLWRFWRGLPRLGRVTIYDRSWYGRVLVERLEGFCAPEEWQRAYGEINAFEEQLVESGNVVLKFWLAITPEEQLRRFKDRQTTPYKQYKITEEDWRNRKKWGAYEAAACDMIERTSTEIAPWTLVPADDKNAARLQVLETFADRLEAALEGGGKPGA
jgi:polyphosphate:AMP phosphotransferase